MPFLSLKVQSARGRISPTMGMDSRAAEQCARSTYHLAAANDAGLSQHKTPHKHTHTHARARFRPALSPTQCLDKKREGRKKSHATNYKQIALLLLWNLCVRVCISGSATRLPPSPSSSFHILSRNGREVSRPTHHSCQIPEVPSSSSSSWSGPRWDSPTRERWGWGRGGGDGGSG